MVSLQVTLLRSKLTELLDNFLQPEFKDILGMMEIMGHLLYRLGVHGIGIASFKIAQHLLRLFTDVSWEVGGVGWQNRAAQGCRQQSETSTTQHPVSAPSPEPT